MARPLRIEFPGANYHVMNRGDDRRVIFVNDTDRTRFLSFIEEQTAAFKVHIRAYCLMPNHFHLYVQTPEGNLSRFMHALLCQFSMYKNRHEESNGHIFQGRYKAVIVDNLTYYYSLSRYIHLNPVRTRELKGASVEEKQRVLRTYPWSSYPAVIGKASAPGWFNPELCLDESDAPLADRRANYIRFVEEGLVRDLPNPLEHVVARIILGSETFIEEIRKQHVARPVKAHCPSARQLGAFVKVEAVVVAVARAYGVAPDLLLRANSPAREARQALIFLAHKHCRGRYSVVELGRHLHLHANAIPGQARRFHAHRTQDATLAARIEALEAEIETAGAAKAKPAATG